jgi:predicted  nucleic acid-binding Zn-ribbon protein
MSSMLKLRLTIAAFAILACAAAVAQDVPGIEICTVEKDMVRRTSCLQSNVNFLQQSLTKQSQAAQQKLDAANREIEALKTQLAGLRKEIDELKGAAKKKEPEAAKEPAKK